MIDLHSVGVGKAHESPNAAYKAQHGHYKNPVDGMSEHSKLPVTQLPMAPQAKPFVVGPMSSGGR